MKRTIWVALIAIVLAAFALSGVAATLDPSAIVASLGGVAMLGITADESKQILEAITASNTAFEQFLSLIHISEPTRPY